MDENIVFLYLGQCGVQIGSEMWDLFCHEHKIDMNGRKKEGKKKEDFDSNNNNRTSVLFSEPQEGHFVPRACFIDSEPSVVDRLRSGNQRRLFNQEHCINTLQECSGNYARAYCTFSSQKGKNPIDRMMESVRKQAEACSKSPSFISVSSLCGGTGSGLTAQLGERLDSEFKNSCHVGINQYPSRRYSNCVVETYNTALAMESFMRNMDLSICFDNESLYNLAEKKLEMETPTFSNINRLISQVASSLTCDLRLGYSTNQETMSQKISRLSVSKNKIFVIPRLAKIRPKNDIIEKSSSSSMTDIFNELFFDPDNTMLSANCHSPSLPSLREYKKLINPLKRKRMRRDPKEKYRMIKKELRHRYFSYDLLFRGTNFNTFEIFQFMSTKINNNNNNQEEEEEEDGEEEEEEENKKEEERNDVIRFVNSNKQDVQIQSNCRIHNCGEGELSTTPESYDHEMSGTKNGILLSNHSSISDVFYRIWKDFRKIYNKRAYVHWFVGEGIESSAFNSSDDNLMYLFQEYDKCIS